MRLLLLLALAAGCAQSQPTTPATPATPAAASSDAEWGSSFGMCTGYCNTSLVVSGRTATFTETTRDAADPPLVQAREITAEEEARLAEALALSSVATETLGCPDCADGGAEYVQVGGERVTFEYNGNAGSAAPIAEAMRAIVRGFPGRR